MLAVEAREITGTLSNPSKMPSRGTSIPPKYCGVGSRLREIPGSVCEDCYACKGRYLMPNVQDSMDKRYQGLRHPKWVEAMVKLISGLREPYFRWFDAGDLQGIWHLANIVEVAVTTPHISYWLPTKQWGYIVQYVRDGGVVPENLTIRLSGYFVDGDAPAHLGFPTSTVHKDGPPKGLECPAIYQDGECKDCRACWNADVPNVSYGIH